jgi:acyl-homoserine lactone acylase PvdQ
LKEYRELGLPDLLPTAEGSNCFVISGEHTESGRPLLAHDPHLENVIPSQWYQIKGSYYLDNKLISFSGVSPAGLTIIIGKGDYLTFGVTTIYTDNQDLYKEKIEDDKYLVNGKWINLSQREEMIKVKGKESVKWVVK